MSVFFLWRWELVIFTYVLNKTPESIFQITRGQWCTQKNVIWVRSDNSTAAFFVGFIVTVFVPDIEGIQNKAMFLNWNNSFSEYNEHGSANLYDISRPKPYRKAPNLK